MTDRPGALPAHGGSEGSPLPGKNPTLVPTPSLGPDEFEDFTERLLSAHRFCAAPLRHVAVVERWGRRGDKQHGIDFKGVFSDGTTACWQCKRYDKLTVRHVRDAVAACTFVADEYYLVLSGEASSAVRAEIAKHRGWQLLDQRGLGQLLDDLPLHKRRDVLDATWGVQKRKLLLEMPGEDTFLSLAAFAADRCDPQTVLNDLAPRVGRDVELARLAAALDRDGDWPVVVLVTGPGGRGKTRLLVEALTRFQRDDPGTAVILLSPGGRLDSAALRELPYTPAVIVVDDAHRDPEGIASLLTYARTVSDTQLVLASRPTGTQALHTQIIGARFASTQVETVAVGELTRMEARALVASLTEGLGLPWSTREYFADQAVDSPYVAVVAANLIRRGKLTGPLAVDAGLREQVLARYQELAVDGTDGDSARRLLGVYAALGPVDDTDEELRDTIADFCDLKIVALFRLVEHLRDRGVLVTRHGGTRVVPDVLADDILEGEATVGHHDTGFAQELWRAFGPGHGDRLVAELAELDWRLTRQGGPTVFPRVWEAVRAELREADLDGLDRALGRLSGLTTTQPELLIDVLEEVRARLDSMETSHTTADMLRSHLPDLYGRCAMNAPKLLETALDALWDLRRFDHRSTHQFPGHPERVIAEHLAGFGRLPDESFPDRIVARVEVWLTELADGHDAASPLFALKALLAKDGHHTVLESRNTLRFNPFLVSSAWARPIRDRIRVVLGREAAGGDVRRAGAAVELLGDALRAPRGGFGLSICDEDVLAWEDDDLAALAALAKAVRSTGSPVIRRHVRRKVTWTAEHAVSLPLRHAALTLVTDLDEREDDLAELLLTSGYSAIPSRRGVPVPTIDELRTAQMARDAHDADLTVDQRQTESKRHIEERMALRQAAQQDLTVRVASHLAGLGDAARIVCTLDACLREVRAVDRTHTVSPWLLRQVTQARPDLAAGLVREIAGRSEGPVDECLHWLLDAWVDIDETMVLTWLDDLPYRRPAVRLAVANAFVNFSWTGRGDAFVDVQYRGLSDPDPLVRDRFLLGGHALLKARPVETTEVMLAAGISPKAATNALELACHYDGTSWGSGLDEPAALAILKLISHTTWSDYTVQQIASGIAGTHPALFLDHLETLRDAGGRLPIEIDGITAVLDEAAEVLVGWLVDSAPRNPRTATAVVYLAMRDGVTARQAECLSAAVDELDGQDLFAVATVLNALATWPLSRPNLARRITHRARQMGPAVAGAIREQVVGAMLPRSWSGSNGFSAKLHEASTNAGRAVAEEEDEELRQDFQQALTSIEERIAALARRYQDWADA